MARAGAVLALTRTALPAPHQGLFPFLFPLSPPVLRLGKLFQVPSSKFKSLAALPQMTPKLSHSKAGGGGGQEFRPQKLAGSSESSGRHLLAESSGHLETGGGECRIPLVPEAGPGLAWDLGEPRGFTAQPTSDRKRGERVSVCACPRLCCMWLRPW